MVRNSCALSVGLILLAGCTPPTKVVEVQVPVEIPGPVQYIPIPADLLACPGNPEPLRTGMTGDELRRSALEYQERARCLDANMAKIRELSQGVTP